MSKLKGILVWPFILAVKFVLFWPGLIIVPIGLAWNKLPRLFTSTRNIPTFWENAIRNPVDGIQFWFKQPDFYSIDGNNLDVDMEPGAMSQKIGWQYRHSGWFSSFRVVYKFDNGHYSEFFLGFKLGMSLVDSPMDFASQLRYSEVGS